MRSVLALSCLTLGLLAAAGAHAQGSTSSHDAWRARYQAEIAECNKLPTPEAAANCRRDVGAAYQSARQGDLADYSSEQLRQNALQRCYRLPADLREDCLINMQEGPNTEIHGSVSGGGILRKTEITVPAGT